MKPEPRVALVIEELRKTIREEIRIAEWGGPFAEVEPLLADPNAERVFLATLRSGFGKAEDLEGLGAEHFALVRVGQFVELEINSIRGGERINDDAQVRVISRVSGVAEESLIEWLHDTDINWPCCLYPSVKDQARRIMDLAAQRRFFDDLAALETDCRHASIRGVEIGFKSRLRRILNNLNDDLGLGKNVS